MIPYLRAANVKDGSLDLTDVKEMNFTPSEQKIFSLRPGDILVTEGSGSLGAVGASAVWNGEISGPICFQNTLVRLRPRDGVSDGRYLAWWARAAYGSGRFASIASGANIYHVSAERIKGLPARLPSLVEQRRIATFLDRESKRICEVLTARRAQLSALDRLESSLLHEHIAAPDAASVRVKHLATKITSGPRGWGDLVGDEGSPFIRIANVPRRGISLLSKGMAHINVPAGPERERTRTLAGDVLVTITADIGSVGVVDDAKAGGNVSQHIALVRPDPAKCHPEWLAYAIKSPAARQQLDAKSYGGTKVGLGLSDIAELRLPKSELAEQRRVAEVINEALQALNVLRSSILRQVAVLVERRQALIAAAVTGQIDVSTASGAAV